MTKLAYIYVGLIVSMGLTTLWEEWLVWRMAGRRAESTSFFGPVIRANLYMMVVLMGAAALAARLKSPHFLLFLFS